MNRRDFAKRITTVMRENNVRKHVSSPKHVFHISDDDGNKKDFVVRRTDKNVLFTLDDIDAMLDACVYVICEALKKGEPISIKGFGTLGLKYRKQRATKRPGTDEWVDVEARYIPKFSFGNDLRMCAKIYELSLKDGILSNPLPLPDEDTDTEDA